MNKALLIALCAALFGGVSLVGADTRLNYAWIKPMETARLNVPPGVVELCWQRYDRRTKKWVDVRVLPASQSGKSITIPGPGGQAVRAGSRPKFRPLVRLLGRTAASPQFRGNFLRGSKRFPGNPEPGTVGVLGNLALATPSRVSDVSISSTTSAEPLESDIWKIEGNTIYYFNELRGLQVIDASEPADPVLVTSYRLPARGQDLYVLPRSSGGKKAILVTYNNNGSSSSGTEVLAIGVGSNSTTLLSSATLPGWPVDSRVIGDTLYVLTNSWSDSSGNWVPTIRLATFDLSADALVRNTLVDFRGASPVLAAGSDWLAISYLPPDEWQRSEVRVFRPEPSGLQAVSPSPLRLSGSLDDKFKLRVAGDILTTISISWTSGWNSRRTILENFRLAPGAGTSPVGSLTLAEGESLFATRFDGDRAYIVTFLQKDPLWVLDLSDPVKPTIAGHLEVPGWSTHLAPLGDGLLFSIGYDNGKVTSSLFDVADPASPTLLSRVSSGEGWSWSEATWDEKALKVLPEEGLALVPFSTWKDGKSQDAVQILSVDREARTLSERGVINHDFSPRRAAALGDNIASVSQRELIIVDTADLDNPSVLSDTLLAWPVDRVFTVGDFLLEIENGSAWSSSPAAIRVASTSDPDALSFDLPIGNKGIIGADIRGDSLYLVRQTAFGGWFRPFLVASGAPAPAGDPLDITLEIYSLKALPEITLTSAITVSSAPSITTSVSKVSFSWPKPETLALLLQGRDAFWWGGPIICFDSPMPVASAVVRTPSKLAKTSPAATLSLVAQGDDRLMGCFPYFRSNVQAALWSLDLSEPAAPSSLGLLRLGNDRTISVSSPVSADGVVAVGYDVREIPEVPAQGDSPTPSAIVRSNLEVFDFAPKSAPVSRGPVDLPGTFTALTNFSSSSGFIWTLRNDGNSPRVEVCSYDGADATLLDGAAVANSVLAVDNTSLFAATPSGISRYNLSPEGLIVPAGTAVLGAAPDQIALKNGRLLAKSGYRLFALDAFPSPVSEWTSPLWIPDLSLASGDDALFLPAGVYGVQSFALPEPPPL